MLPSLVIALAFILVTWTLINWRYQNEVHKSVEYSIGLLDQLDIFREHMFVVSALHVAHESGVLSDQLLIESLKSAEKDLIKELYGYADG